MNRLVVIEAMTYIEEGKPNSSVSEVRHAEIVRSDEEAFQRTLTVGPEPVTVDLAWCASHSMLCIKNLAPQHSRVPSAAKAVEEAKRGAVLVSFGDGPPSCVVRPNLQLRVELLPGVALRLKSTGANVKVRVVAVPK